MSNPDDVPTLVSKALHNSLVSGWLNSTRTETGRLLATLAASREGIVAEASTGSGTGVAWLRSGARSGTHVICVENDVERAARARETLDGADVEVLDGGCEVLRQRGPFSMLYMAGTTAHHVDRDLVHDLVEPGGLVVIDDFNPSDSWPPRDETGHVDQLRQGWLSDDRYSSSEVVVAADLSVVLATRR